jgi:hypothetical protein
MRHRFFSSFVGLAMSSTLAVACSGNATVNGSSTGSGGAGASTATGGRPGGASGDASTDGPGFVFGTGGVGGAGGLTDSGPIPDGACGINTMTATTREVNLLLVIDKSGSMVEKPAGFTTDKWTALKTALESSLGAVKNSMSLGLELYPLSADPQNPIPVLCSANCCEMPAPPGINVAVAPGATSVPAILAALGSAANAPGGGTPTAEALRRARDYFVSGAGNSLTGDKYVLLATDGGPNCNANAPQCDATTCTLNLDRNCPIAGTDAGGSRGNCCDQNFAGPSLCLDDAETVKQIQSLSTADIKTFVVGIPGSEAYETYLDAFALAGGGQNPSAPPNYFAVSASGGVAELTNVLSSITKTLIKSCELKLTSEPRDYGLLNVYVDGRALKRDDPNGWSLDTTTRPPTVDLKGTTCTEVETKGAESVRIVFGCPSLH